MGILQLAGAVSGAGEKMSRSLDTLQTGMLQEHLLAERDKYENLRLEKTFKHDTGMINMRAKLDRDLMNDRAAGERQLMLDRAERDDQREDRRYSRELDVLDQKTDADDRRARIGRQFDREQDEKKATAELEKEKRARTEKLADDEQKRKDKINEEKRQEVRDRAKRQEEGGFRLTEQMLQNQRPHGGSTTEKLDPKVNAKLKMYDQQLKDLSDEAENVMTKPERLKQIRIEQAQIRDKMNGLIDTGSDAGRGTSSRKPYVDPY